MDTNAYSNPSFEMSPQAVAEALLAGEIDVIDIREPHEREAGYIDGSRHIEIERIAGRNGEVSRNRRTVFHCRLGMRGGMIAAAFRSIGVDAWNMPGGLVAWAEAGLPLAPEDGSVSEH